MNTIADAVINARKKHVAVIVSLGFLLAASFFVCLIWGSSSVGISGILKPENRGILQLRACGILLGIIAGASLSVAGAVLQAVLRNQLAEPYVLGISSGASLGAVTALALGLGGWTAWFGLLPLAAFIGAVLTMLLVYNLAKVGGRLPAQSLLLAGVVTTSILSSLLIFILSVAPPRGIVHSAMWWLLGNLQIFDIKLLAAVGAISLSGMLACMFFWKELNAISMGEEEAVQLGIRVEALKKLLFVIISLITGAVVSTCGIIGFVGLIVPHTMRLIAGPDHKILLPASALAGAGLLILCDLAARTLMRPVQIPIGVITALMGGPFFLFLLRMNLKR